MYLGRPRGVPITGPPYTIYLDAESVLGVSVRLEGDGHAGSEHGAGCKSRLNSATTATFHSSRSASSTLTLNEADRGRRSPTR